MDDRSSRLDALRIDRDDITKESNRISVWGVRAGLLLIAVAGGYWIGHDRVSPQVPAKASVATAATTPVAPAQSSSNTILEASGYVVARRQATVSAKIAGQLKEVLIEEGERVEAGQIIARLDDSNAAASVAQAKARLKVAQVTFDTQRPIFERNANLIKEGWISKSAFENAKGLYETAKAQVVVEEANLAIAQRNLEDSVVRAPFAGIVTVKAAQPGEIVSPVATGSGFTRTGIATIVDMDSLEVEVDVSETYIYKVYPHQPVKVLLNAYADWTIPAEVISVIPAADRSKATVKVRIALNSKDSRIVPEMGARVAFLREDKK